MTTRTITRLLASLSFFACTSLFAAPLVVDVTGVQSYGELGDAGNTVLTYNVGAFAAVTVFSYNVNLTAYDPSYLSEMTLRFGGTDTAAVDFNPAFGDDYFGTGSYAGSGDLVDLGISFNVGADGLLRLEFYEGFDDFVGADGQWNSGTLTFVINGDTGANVPEPGTTALFGAGLLLMAYAARRRRAP
jgi:hypothetical protein